VDWIQQPLKLGVYKDTKALQLEQAGSGLMHSMSKAAAGVTAGEAAGHRGREQLTPFGQGFGALLFSEAEPQVSSAASLATITITITSWQCIYQGPAQAPRSKTPHSPVADCNDWHNRIAC